MSILANDLAKAGIDVDKNWTGRMVLNDRGNPHNVPVIARVKDWQQERGQFKLFLNIPTLWGLPLGYLWWEDGQWRTCFDIETPEAVAEADSMLSKMEVEVEPLP